MSNEDIPVSMDTRAREFGVRIEVSAPKRERDADNWEHDRYRVRLTLQGRTMTLTYRKGTGHNGNPPQLAEVLDCLASDAAGVENADSFEEWAGEYGYDTDSRKAEAIYRAASDQTSKLRKLLGDERFDLLVWHTERE